MSGSSFSQRPKWEVVLRTFGYVHFLFAALGVYYIGEGVYGLVTGGYFAGPVDPSTPFEREAYLVRTAINLVFLGGLVYAGLSLLRGRARAVRMNNILFASLIAYFFGEGWLPWSSPLGKSIGVTGGIGEVGTILMIVTGYPVVCLVALNLAHRRLKRLQATEEPPHEPQGH